MQEQEPLSGPRSTERAKDNGPESEEQAPISQRGDFGFGGMKELLRLERAAKEARELANQNPDDERLRMRAETAEMRVEIFDLEHDQAGAFQFSRFGAEMVKMFEPGADGKPAIKIDAETGKLALAESEKDRRIMMVSMGELDRLNKEGGGHAAGDTALRETVRAIETAALTTLGADIANADIQVLRYGGNEYMVSMKGVPQEKIDGIMEQLRSHWHNMRSEGNLDAKLAEIGVSEPPPLTVSSFELAEVVDVMSQAQQELSPELRVSQDDPYGAARETIEALRLQANYQQDLNKFHTAAGRLRDVQEGPGGIEKARELFTYLKKMFKEPLTDARAFATLPENVINRLAKEYAVGFLQGDTAAAEKREAMIGQSVREMLAERRAQDMREGRGIAPARTEIAPPNGAKMAEVPDQTEGQKDMDKHRVAALSAVESGDADVIAHAEALRDKEVRKRELGTGQLTRKIHYRQLESAFRKGEQRAMVFIDMGFLKLFDKEGGSDVGDNALKMSASILEQTMKESGFKGDVFRYAGDEFTVQLEGGAADAEEFRRQLMERVKDAGAIPVGKKGSAAGYQPTELVFNCGVSDTAMTERVYADLVAAGAYTERDLNDPDRVLNEKANLMTVIADKGVERPKAVERLELLINSFNDPAYDTDPARKQQVDGIALRSEKAIFGLPGKEFLRQMLATGKTAEELRPQLEAFVDAQLEKVPEQKNRKNGLTAKLIELHGDLSYYKQAYEQATRAEVVTSMELERLKAEVQRVEKERQALIDVRKALE